MKNDIIRLGVILCVISAIAGLVLGLSNMLTADKIEEVIAATTSGPEVANAVVPGSVSLDDYPDAALVEQIKSEDNKFVDLKVCKDASGNELGYGIRTLSPVGGFGGDIEIYLGISPEGKIVGMRVLAHSETVGLGAKVENADFQEQFIGRSVDTEIGVAKTSPADTEIQALAGATYSSKSITSAVNNALKIYNKYLKK